MDTRSLSVGVIGAGRVGAVLATALRTAGHPIAAVAGESDASRTRIETMLPGIRRDKPTAVARACDLLFLTVPDDSLDNVVRMLVGAGAIHTGQLVVHTSGRHGTAILRPAVDVGARAIALHPAMTFTGTDLDLDRLATCVVAVTCAEPEQAPAAALIAEWGGRPLWVDEADRAAYHAGLAHGANHLATLVGQAVDMLRAAHVDDPAAVLRPLLSAALDNALEYGDAGLTGPVVRGDVETLASHVATVAATTPESLDSYLALARATTDRAVRAGRLEPRRATALGEVLDAAEAVVRA